jgi:hypothetical protein
MRWMEKYYPAGDKFDALHVAAYVEGQLMVEILKRSGTDLTRRNVMAQAANLKNVQVAMLRSGITASTTPATPFKSNRERAYATRPARHWLSP